jgi:aminoglycoside phosphotransferase (APT) family kinase protein
VDERWAFRFPRRAIAIPGVERELATLPRIAPELPLPVPVPVFVGRPALGYPWPFFGAALIPGREPCGLSDAARRRIAPVLAAFLRALHDAAPDGLPVDPNRRADMPYRTAMTREALAELGREAPALLLDAADALPPPEGDVLLHGDLHVRHLVVADDALAGVIDWGDVCRGDPSVDLSLLWSFFPPDARHAFLAAYGPVSDAQLLRARALAVNLCAILAVYGHHEGMAELEREALDGLERAVA